MCVYVCVCVSTLWQQQLSWVCTHTSPFAIPSVPQVSHCTQMFSLSARPLDSFPLTQFLSTIIYYFIFFVESVETFQWRQGQKFLHITSQPLRTLTYFRHKDTTPLLWNTIQIPQAHYLQSKIFYRGIYSYQTRWEKMIRGHITLIEPHTHTHTHTHTHLQWLSCSLPTLHHFCL